MRKILESIWAGSTEDAFFSAEIFDRHRILRQPEVEASGRSSKQAYYILSVDVGRKGDETVICILKVTPQAQGNSIKSLVNMYTLTDEDFESQSIKIKKLYYKYKARRIVIDGNGLGIGLIDEMVKARVDPVTNDTLPDFGIYNDDEGYYKKYRSDICEDNVIYIIKANAPINTEAHANAKSQLESGRLKFLINEREAKVKLLSTKIGQDMRPDDRTAYLRPFILTSVLCEQMMNLREENEGLNIILKQANKKIKKDKFSSLEYGLYYIKKEEEKKKKKRKFSDFMFLSGR